MWPNDDEYGTDYHLAHGLEPPPRRKIWLPYVQGLVTVILLVGIVGVLLWLIQDTCR